MKIIISHTHTNSQTCNILTYESENRINKSFVCPFFRSDEFNGTSINILNIQIMSLALRDLILSLLRQNGTCLYECEIL